MYDDVEICNAVGVYKGSGSGSEDSTNAHEGLIAHHRKLNRLSVSPNPTSGTVTITYTSGGKIELVDLLGRVVTTIVLPEGDTQVKAIIDNLDPGIYMYRHIQFGKQYETGKLVLVQ